MAGGQRQPRVRQPDRRADRGAEGLGLVIWSGDPLALGSRVRQALISGAEIYSAAGAEPRFTEPFPEP